MAVAATTVSAKLYMSFGIRAKMMGMSDEEKEKFQPTYEKVHNAQLNEATLEAHLGDPLGIVIGIGSSQVGPFRGRFHPGLMCCGEPHPPEKTK